MTERIYDVVSKVPPVDPRVLDAGVTERPDAGLRDAVTDTADVTRRPRYETGSYGTPDTTLEAAAKEVVRLLAEEASRELGSTPEQRFDLARAMAEDLEDALNEIYGGGGWVYVIAGDLAEERDRERAVRVVAQRVRAQLNLRDLYTLGDVMEPLDEREAPEQHEEEGDDDPFDEVAFLAVVEEAAEAAKKWTPETPLPVGEGDRAAPGFGPQAASSSPLPSWWPASQYAAALAHARGPGGPPSNFVWGNTVHGVVQRDYLRRMGGGLRVMERVVYDAAGRGYGTLADLGAKVSVLVRLSPASGFRRGRTRRASCPRCRRP